MGARYLKPTILFCCFIISLNVHAQTYQTKRYIQGTVIDTANATPLEFVTIHLRNMADAHIADYVTDKSGRFSVEVKSSGHYMLQVNAIGYSLKKINIEILEDDTIKSVGQVYLSKSFENLQEVTIKATKQLTKQAVDRISYDVKNDPESKAANTFELLRKVPLVSIGMNDEIQVNGKQSYVILVNGKPSAILNKDPSNYLRNQKALDIDHIDILTTPPSKYSQNGVTEVINIITKSGKIEGAQATVRSTYSTLNDPASTFTGEVKKQWFGLTLYSGYSFRSPPDTYSNSEIKPVNPLDDHVLQSGINQRKVSYLNLIPELSFDLDSINLITTSVEYGKLNIRNNNDLTTIIYDPALLSNQRTLIFSTDHTNNIAYNGYYQHQGKRNKDRLFSLGYRFSNPDRTIRDITSGLPNLTNSQLNSLTTKEHTLQADYSHPLKSLTIEGGIKNIWRTNLSTGESTNGNTISQQTDLNDKQNALIAYNTYYLKKSKWGVKVGVRYERTNLLSGNVNSTFNNLIPIVSLQWKIKKSLLSFNYDQDIERPAIYQLNNFINTANPAFNYSGNPNLKPFARHKFELNYNLNAKYFMRFSAYYYLSNGEITSYTSKLNDSVNLLSYYNAGRKDDLGIKYSSSFRFTKQFDLSFNSRVSYVKFNSIVGNSQYVNDGVEFFSTTNGSYLLKDGWRASIYVRVSNPYINPQGKGFWWTDHSFSINKKFINNLMNCTVSVDDPFMKFRNRRNSVYLNENYTLQNTQEVVRKLFFSVSYQFGRMKYQIRKADKQISNTDVKTEQ